MSDHDSMLLPRDRRSANPITLLWHRWVKRHEQESWVEGPGSWVGDRPEWTIVRCACGKWWVTP